MYIGHARMAPASSFADNRVANDRCSSFRKWGYLPKISHVVFTNIPRLLMNPIAGLAIIREPGMKRKGVQKSGTRPIERVAPWAMISPSFSTLIRFARIDESGSIARVPIRASV
ncbi:MAG: hypothetical protein BWY50_00045 [Spirochaetes bacterium ADurb.Bin315]|nr:MAG: hypothetical protein BWY50_00045 [Spirochaetes bacterium ADurb.Bin315]